MIYYIDDINIRCIRVKYGSDVSSWWSIMEEEWQKEREKGSSEASGQQAFSLSFSFSAAVCYADSIADNHPPRIAPHRTWSTYKSVFIYSAYIRRLLPDEMSYPIVPGINIRLYEAARGCYIDWRNARNCTDCKEYLPNTMDNSSWN